MDVDLTDAYQEACTALGESVIRERLLMKEVKRLQTLGSAETETDPEQPGGAT